MNYKIEKFPEIKQMSVFLAYFFSDLNEITFFGDLLDYAVGRLDLANLEKEARELKEKGIDPIQEVLLLNLKNNIHRELKSKLVFIYLNSIFECYLNNVVRFLCEKYYGILGSIEIEIKELIEKSKEVIIYSQIEKITKNILYGGYSEIIKNIDRKFNLKIQSQISNSELEDLDQFKETRNILLHWKTKISNLLTMPELELQQTTQFEEEIEIDFDYVIEFRDIVTKTVIIIDHIICKSNPEVVT